MKHIVLSLLFFLVFASCNPVKKILKDQEKFEQVAVEVIRRGYCTNDTTIVVTHTDTVVITEEKQFIDSVLIDQGLCNFDTTLKSGLRIKFENRYLYVTEKALIKTKIVTKHVNNYIKDVAYEQILKKDIEALNGTIKVLEGKVSVYKETNKELTKKLGTIKLYFILFIIFIVLITLYKIVKKFTSPIL